MIRTFATRDAAMDAAALRMADALNTGIAARGEAIAALSGGSTPGPAYERLAQLPLDWSKITFALIDERFVPLRDPASNEGLIRRTLAPAFAHGARLLPLYADVPSVSAAADLADPLYQPLTFDIALMGMGEDGHTASWFPGGDAAALDPNTTRSVMAVIAPAARGAAERLTVTYPLIRRARSVLLLITGEAKRTVLERARALPVEQAPVAALFSERAPEVFWAP
jgi:6-phosphogluconolactonase